MTLTADLRDLHFTNQHQCCWIVDGETRCGLWCGHDGGHTPHDIGVYLPPPIISPLALLALPRLWPCTVCLVCGARAEYASWEGPFRTERDGDGNVAWFDPGDSPGDVERHWHFGPCGCEGREILRW